jgi:hypothetical protein
VRALEEANRENRRIIAALTQRIPEIDPPQDSASEPREAPETAAEDVSGVRYPRRHRSPYSAARGCIGSSSGRNWVGGFLV